MHFYLARSSRLVQLPCVDTIFHVISQNFSSTNPFILVSFSSQLLMVLELSLLSQLHIALVLSPGAVPVHVELWTGKMSSRAACLFSQSVDKSYIQQLVLF
ncbi:Histone superfamily protein [Zea mays]|jgi:hypothetical protein|uniref:Histone superfamily protein n=1 Tax=Zea mays TaxID=4577 RepID=A0A1D6EC38_MAIZE|nr:Histone superfamily protein [Zea mays]